MSLLIALFFPLLSPGFGLRATGIVDRIEGAFAVVEWRIETLTDVPLPLLPLDIGEGDPLLLALHPSSRGAALALDPRTLYLAGSGSLALPPEIRVQPGLRYRVGLRAGPKQPTFSPASRPRMGRMGCGPTQRPDEEVL